MFTQGIGKDFKTGEMADAHELFLKIISYIDSFINENEHCLESFFSFIIETVEKCKCRNIKLTEQSYWPLFLPSSLVSSVNLTTEINKYFQEENKEKGSCSTCKEQISTGQTFSSIPQVFCIQIQRIVYNDQTKRALKNRNEVEYEKTLLIKQVTFHLIAIVCHSGKDCNSGHFNAIVRSSSGWIVKNDTNCYVISEEAALETNSSVYMLYYANSKYLNIKNAYMHFRNYYYPGFVRDVTIKNDIHKFENLNLIKRYKKANNYQVEEIIITVPDKIDLNAFWANTIKRYFLYFLLIIFMN